MANIGIGDAMKVKSNIGKYIDESPYKREYIQKHFNKSRNTIYNWCVGNSYPSVPELFELAKLLNRWVDDLYEEVKEKKDLCKTNLEELDYSPRVYNLLKRNGINSVNDLLNFDLERIQSLGPKAKNEIESKLSKIRKEFED